MTDGADILARVLADPADDAVRLVYADWLQENGQDEWAELIRLQVELARPEPVAPPSASNLFRADQYLEHRRQRDEYHAAVEDRRAKGDRAARAMRGVKVPVPAGWAVRTTLMATLGARGELRLFRGFAEHALCPAAVWFEDAGRLAAMHPVRRVTLTTRPETAEDGRAGLAWFVARPAAQLTFGRIHDEANRFRSSPGDAALLAMLALVWPRITFDLQG